MSPTRSQAQRDAVTVEIAFAVVTGALAGVLAFLICAAPVLWDVLPASWRGSWLMAAALIGGAAFVHRVVRVLWRWRQPSQPGRTSPDS
ncbi:DUF6332 family protein [Streptomyces purpurogeneiscleroticus]|uniref:DUF6332 family protein n=1 Tax=Streptomyces purpurogeneiscleroticus TaxID=68259 RepID=UPI001CBC7086|nr:DUF6332 family protein [Streptomyces purpurogeneiscleroticus]MBZ4015007.1 hypothetical protein [Streptomyces purpurogeneiscleroticus]